MEKKRASEVEAARERRAQKRGRAEMEAEEREKGLGTELDATNKGFAMLQKMGYKKGMQCTRWGPGGHLFRRFCLLFFRVPQAVGL